MAVSALLLGGRVAGLGARYYPRPRLGYYRHGGGLGSFLVHAALWHLVGRAIDSLFRIPVLGGLVMLVLGAVLVTVCVRYLTRRSRYRRASARWVPPGRY